MADLDLDAIAGRKPWDGTIYITGAERDALVAVARWAQDAPHHDGCLGRYNDDPNDPPRNPYLCACGRDEALAPFGGDRG